MLCKENQSHGKFESQSFFSRVIEYPMTREQKLLKFKAIIYLIIHRITLQKLLSLDSTVGTVFCKHVH